MLYLNPVTHPCKGVLVSQETRIGIASTHRWCQPNVTPCHMYPWLKARAMGLIGSGNTLVSIFPWLLGAMCVQRGVLPQLWHSIVTQTNYRGDLKICLSQLGPMGPCRQALRPWRSNSGICRYSGLTWYRAQPCLALYVPLKGCTGHISAWLNHVGMVCRVDHRARVNGGYIYRIYGSGDSI